MPGIDVNNLLNVQRLAQNPYPDNSVTPTRPRGGRYGEQAVLSYVPTKHMLADEGSYWVTTNPTIGTAVTYALQTSFSDTAAMFVIQNTDTPGPTARRLYLDYIRLLAISVAASATSVQFAAKVDSISRVPTANTQTLTPVNVNSDIQSVASPAAVYAFSSGALTVPASSGAARTVARGSLRSVLPITLDEMVLVFGDNPAGGVVGSTAGRFVGNAAPIVIGPQQFFVFYLWEPSAATTTPTFEFELALWAR